MSISISETAARHVSEQLLSRGHGLGIRVGVTTTGCSGMAYVLEFADNLEDGDQVFEAQGIKIIVDPKSLSYLSGTVLDFSDGLNGKGFVFNNPQATKTCGCGSSFGV